MYVSAHSRNAFASTALGLLPRNIYLLHRSEANCKQVRRRSTKSDLTGQLPVNNAAGGGGGGGGIGGGGGGTVPAPAWFPSLVQQMETRKMETTQNLARGHAKART